MTKIPFSDGQFFVLLMAAGCSVVLALLEMMFYAFRTARKSRRRGLSALPRRSFGSVFRDEVMDALGCGTSAQWVTFEFESHSFVCNLRFLSASPLTTKGPFEADTGPSVGEERLLIPQHPQGQ